MNWYELFYLMTMADRLQSFFLTFAWIATIIGVVALIVWLVYTFNEDNDQDTAAKKAAFKWIALFWPVMIFCWFAWVATPSKKDALLIVAGGAVGQFITTDSSAQRLPSDITRFLRVKILEQTQGTDLKDLKGFFLQEDIDTLKNKSREELLEIIKKQTR